MAFQLNHDCKSEMHVPPQKQFCTELVLHGTKVQATTKVLLLCTCPYLFTPTRFQPGPQSLYHKGTRQWSVRRLVATTTKPMASEKEARVLRLVVVDGSTSMKHSNSFWSFLGVGEPRIEMASQLLEIVSQKWNTNNCVVHICTFGDGFSARHEFGSMVTEWRTFQSAIKTLETRFSKTAVYRALLDAHKHFEQQQQRGPFSDAELHFITDGEDNASLADEIKECKEKYALTEMNDACPLKAWVYHVGPCGNSGGSAQVARSIKARYVNVEEFLKSAAAAEALKLADETQEDTAQESVVRRRDTEVKAAPQLEVAAGKTAVQLSNVSAPVSGAPSVFQSTAVDPVSNPSAQAVSSNSSGDVAIERLKQLEPPPSHVPNINPAQSDTRRPKTAARGLIRS